MQTITGQEPTDAELRAAYWRSRVSTIGLSYRDAMAIPTLAWSLHRAAISHRNNPPIQKTIFEDIAA
jgi:hypothetical protein